MVADGSSFLATTRSHAEGPSAKGLGPKLHNGLVQRPLTVGATNGLINRSPLPGRSKASPRSYETDWRRNVIVVVEFERDYDNDNGPRPLPRFLIPAMLG